MPGDKKSSQSKSPAPKKHKEVIYSKIKVIQQQYRQNLKQIDDAVYEPDLTQIPVEQ
jgi:hypothetical protein